MLAMHPDMESFLADERRVEKVLSMAARRTGNAPGMDWDDFCQEGRIHLWRYAGNYHPETGKAVDGFAYRLVHRGMLDAKRRACGRTGRKIAPWRSQFPATTNGYGDPIEEEFGTDEGGYSLVDARLDLDVLRRRVAPRDWFVAEQVLGFGRTLAAVGVDVGLSESRASQIVAKVKREVWIRKEAAVAETKPCSKCKQEKGADAFAPSWWKKVNAGAWGQCRQCSSTKAPAAYQNPPVVRVKKKPEAAPKTTDDPIAAALRACLDKMDERLAAIDAERNRLSLQRNDILAILGGR